MMFCSLACSAGNCATSAFQCSETVTLLRPSDWQIQKACPTWPVGWGHGHPDDCTFFPFFFYVLRFLEKIARCFEKQMSKQIGADFLKFPEKL
jgi:hypothetical protein